LWQILRGRKFHNLKFVRQSPIPVSINGRSRIFVADFYCHQLRLVIEVDGGIHQTQIEKDRIRTEILNVKGITVIRTENKVILKNLNVFLSRLESLVFPLLLREKGPFSNVEPTFGSGDE
jgi:very-short-patch-repair endonuclease